MLGVLAAELRTEPVHQVVATAQQRDRDIGAHFVFLHHCEAPVI